MKTEKFKYISSTPCYFSITEGKEVKEFNLHNGNEYDLPAEHPFVKKLVAQGKLASTKKTKK